MASSPNLDLKIRILADGSTLVGQTKLSREEMAKLREEFAGSGAAAKASADAQAKYTQNSQSAAAATGQLSSGVKQLTEGVGKLVAGYLSFAALKDAISTSKDFSTTVSDLAAITGAAGGDLKYYREQAQKVGADAGMMAGDMVTAYKLVASGKAELMEVKESLAAVSKETVILAQASRMDLPDSAGALTKSLNQFKEEGDQASRYINVMAAASKEGAAEVKDITESLKNAGTEAKGAGLSFEQVNALVEDAAKLGVKGGEAGTGIRNFISTLTSESDKLKVWGINAKEVNPQIVGISESLHKLQAAHLSSAAMADLFGVENKNIARQLIDDAQSIDDFTQKITGTNVAYEQARIQMDNLDGDLKKLKSSFGNAKIAIGDEFDGSLRASTQEVTAFINSISAIDIKAFFVSGIGEIDLLATTVSGEFNKILLSGKAMYITVGGFFGGLADSAEVKFAELSNYVVRSLQNVLTTFSSATSSLEAVSPQFGGLSKGIDTARDSLNKYTISTYELNTAAKQRTDNVAAELSAITAQKKSIDDEIDSKSKLLDAASQELATQKAASETKKQNIAVTQQLTQATTNAADAGKRAQEIEALRNAQTQEQAKNVSELVTKLMEQAKTAGYLNEIQKQLAWAKENKANDSQITLIQQYQQIAELGKNKELILNKERENQLNREGVTLTGLAYEQFKATLALGRDAINTTSQAYLEQKQAIMAAVAAQLQLQATQKTTETIAELDKETKAYMAGAAGIELYTAKKSLGVGANDGQAQAVVASQLAKSIAEKTAAAKQEYDLSLLSSQAQQIETLRRQMGATATTEQAKGLVELNKITKANNDLQAAQTAVDISGLSKNAQEYLRVMKETNKETGTQINLLNIRAAAQGAGTERLASLREEVMLLQMSAKDQVAYNALKDVAPEQRGNIKALVDQRTELDRVRKSWEATTDKVVDYFAKIATGEMGFKAAFSGLAVELNRDKIKESLDKFKELLKGESSTIKLDGALNFNDAKNRADVTAASAVFKTYEASLMTGTDGSVNKLITGIDTSISKLTQAIDVSLKNVADSLPKAMTVANDSVVKSLDNVTKSINVDSNLASREGLRVKGGLHGEAFGGGDNPDSLMALAHLIQSAEGKQLTMFTAFNDGFHQRRLKKNPKAKSKHTDGLALDFGIKDASKSAEAAQLVRELAKELKIGLYVKDEYKDPSGHATGGHIHVNFKSKEDADKLLSEVTGRVGQSINLHADALDRNKDSVESAKSSTDSLATNVAKSAAVLDVHSGTVVTDAQALGNHAAQANQPPTQGGWGYANNTTTPKPLNATDPSTNVAQYAKGSLGALFSGGGKMEEIGKVFGGGGALEGIGSTISSINSSLGGKLAGLDVSGIGSMAMSVMSGNLKGAAISAIGMGLDAAMPGVGTAFNLIAAPVMGKLFGEWKVEAQHLTANIHNLGGTFQQETIEVNKGMIGGGKKTSYTAVTDEQNKELQTALKSVTTQIESVGKQIGKSLTDSFKFDYTIDMVHAQTGTFEKQFQRAQAVMMKNAFTSANLAGVDASITDVMGDKVQNLLKSASDGVYDKALQGFMWKPDTTKYGAEINGTIKDGLNSLISSTDWSGLDVEKSTAKLQTYLTDAFGKAGVDVPQDTFKHMAEQLSGQIQDGLKFLDTSKSAINPDAPFFKNMRQIVENFDEWNAKPEEVSGFITSVLNLKDAFKVAQIGTQNITQSLLDMAGGSDKIGALTANVNAYSAAFFDDASKNTVKIASLTTDVSSAFAAYGAQMPKTKADFVALANSIDMSTASGQKAFVSLMDIAPKYAELAQLQASAGVGLDMFAAKLADLPKISSSVASAMSNSLNSSVQNKVGAAQAGKDLGKSMAGEIQKSLAGMVTEAITQMVVKGLVTPMLQAGVQNANMTMQAGAMSAQNLAIGGSNAAANMTMGGNNAASGMTSGGNNAASGMSIGGSTAAAALAAGGQVAADYIAGITSQILTTIEVMGKVMADPNLKKAMESITPAVETMGSAAYTSMTDSSSFLSQDFSISTASQQSAANTNGGGSASDTTANDAKTLADSLKKLHESLTDLATGLTGNELTLNKLSRAYGSVDLSMVNLSGNSTDVAKSLNSLSDTQLQSIAAAAGKTIDELSSDMQSYVTIMRDQAKALADFRNGLDKYTASGENNTARTKDLTHQMMLMGVSTEQAVAYIKTLSDTDLSAKAKELNTTSEELRGTVIPAVLQGMMDFETGLKDLKNNTLSTYTVGRKTDSTSQWVEQLSIESAKLGLTAKTAAEWIETLKPEELEAYATKMGVTRDQLIKDVIPQTLTSINSVSEAFRNLGLDMQALTDKSFTPAQRTIAQLAETYPALNIAQNAHSMTSEQLAKYYQSLSKEQIVEFAASIHKLPEDVIKDGVSLVNAMRENENAAKSVADSWIENFKRVTDSIDSLSTSVKVDIGTIEGKKGLSDSISAAKASTDYTYNQRISGINTAYDAAPQTDKSAAMLTKVAATEQAYTDSVATFNGKRATIIADFTAQYAQQNQALRDKIFAGYTGTKANILQDPDELSKRVAAANELRQAITGQFAEQKKAIEEKYKIESDNAAKLLDAAKQIGNTIRDLRLDNTLSTLTKKQQLGESHAAFDELVSKAVNNNDAAAAQEAIAMSKTVLSKGREYEASGKGYTDLFSDVTGKLNGIQTKFGDVTTADKTKPFEETAYASELKSLQMQSIAQLRDIDNAGQWAKEHGTEELATGLVNLGSQFGLDIGQVTDTLKTNFPALGDKLQGVINAIGKLSSNGDVSDSQINEYVQGAIKRAGGLNSNSVKDITETAKYFDIAPDRMAGALGTDTATVSKTAATYGQSYNNISDTQITSFVQDATEKYGMGTKEGVTAIYGAAKDNGVTSHQLANAIGWTDKDVLDMAQQYNLPAFAEGGFVDKPTIALVGEAGPEYIIPAGKIQPASNSGGGESKETNELLQRLIAAHQETQRILQLLLQVEKDSGQQIVGELQQQPRETARLIGQKIDSLNGK